MQQWTLVYTSRWWMRIYLCTVERSNSEHLWSREICNWQQPYIYSCQKWTCPYQSIAWQGIKQPNKSSGETWNYMGWSSNVSIAIFVVFINIFRFVRVFNLCIFLASKLPVFCSSTVSSWRHPDSFLWSLVGSKTPDNYFLILLPWPLKAIKVLTAAPIVIFLPSLHNNLSTLDGSLCIFHKYPGIIARGSILFVDCMRSQIKQSFIINYNFDGIRNFNLDQLGRMGHRRSFFSNFFWLGLQCPRRHKSAESVIGFPSYLHKRSFKTKNLNN